MTTLNPHDHPAGTRVLCRLHPESHRVYDARVVSWGIGDAELQIDDDAPYRVVPSWTTVVEVLERPGEEVNNDRGTQERHAQIGRDSDVNTPPASPEKPLVVEIRHRSPESSPQGTSGAVGGGSFFPSGHWTRDPVPEEWSGRLFWVRPESGEKGCMSTCVLGAGRTHVNRWSTPIPLPGEEQTPVDPDVETPSEFWRSQGHDESWMARDKRATEEWNQLTRERDSAIAALAPACAEASRRAFAEAARMAREDANRWDVSHQFTAERLATLALRLDRLASPTNQAPTEPNTSPAGSGQVAPTSPASAGSPESPARDPAMVERAGAFGYPYPFSGDAIVQSMADFAASECAELSARYKEQCELTQEMRVNVDVFKCECASRDAEIERLTAALHDEQTERQMHEAYVDDLSKEVQSLRAERDRARDEATDVLRRAVDWFCSCGGKGPSDSGACPACMIWHHIEALRRAHTEQPGTEPPPSSRSTPKHCEEQDGPPAKADDAPSPAAFTDEEVASEFAKNAATMRAAGWSRENPQAAPDVFEQVAAEWTEGVYAGRGSLPALLRARFGPLVEAFELIAKHPCGASEADDNDAKTLDKARDVIFRHCAQESDRGMADWLDEQSALIRAKSGRDYHCGECAWCVAKEEVARLRSAAETKEGKT